MIQIIIMLHVLMAVSLLGALTHQAVSLIRRKPASTPNGFINRFRNVHSPAYTNTIILLFCATTLLGGFMYPRYRLDVRSTLEDMQLRAANGFFEIKEHLAAIGLGMLPAYWLYWQSPLVPEHATTRKYLTWMLTAFVWWNFLVGEYLNNIKGLYP
jgi:hypothetical protein